MRAQRAVPPAMFARAEQNVREREERDYKRKETAGFVPFVQYNQNLGELPQMADSAECHTYTQSTRRTI
jgi:hypothetical protein